MAFKPNYRRDRSERQRAARARIEEKKKGGEGCAAQSWAQRSRSRSPAGWQAKL